GKFTVMLICWFLGLGTLVSWNSMLTIGDYYYQVFPNYHPVRVLTIVYTCLLLSERWRFWHITRLGLIRDRF
ncbi:hypothetical protein M569_08020, partial [Genlisea aurea]